MSDQHDAQMGGVSPGNAHAELAADASNVTTSTKDEERASKRLKVNDSIPFQSAPGEDLHDAPAPKENEQSTNGDKENEVPRPKPDPKAEYVDGRSKGVAPIKKE